MKPTCQASHRGLSACSLGWSGQCMTSILQRMGVEDTPDESTLKLSLLTHALKRGVWLLGLAFMIASFLLQAVALHIGP